MTREAIRLHRQKCMAWRRYRISQEPGDEATARLKLIELNKLTCNLEREFEIKLAEDVKTHPKAFWKYSNDKLKTRDKVNDLLKEDGSLTKNNNEKAEVLNSFFKSVFIRTGPDPSLGFGRNSWKYLYPSSYTHDIFVV